MEYLTKDIELGKDEVVVWDKDHIAKFIMNTKTRQTRPVAKINYWDIHSPVNVEKVMSKQDAGLELVKIAKEIKAKEGVSFSNAIDLAVARNPELYKKYAGVDKMTKSAKEEIMQLIADIMSTTKCDMVRASEIATKKYPQLYRRYTDEVMNIKR